MQDLEKDFFKNLNSKIDDLIDDEQPTFGKVYHPFVVPNGYFVELKNAILIKVDALKVSHFKILYKKYKWVSVAASVAIVFSFLTYFAFNNSTTNDQVVALNELSKDDIVAYLDAQPISSQELNNNAILTENELAAIMLENLNDESLVIDDILSNEAILTEIENL